jgi:hypothetical protein
MSVNFLGVMTIEASSTRGFAKQCWLRLGKWLRRMLTTVAVLAGLVWVAIGSLVLIALADSPRHCPPTMGYVDRKTKGCSSWGGFMEPASTRGSCDSGP